MVNRYMDYTDYLILLLINKEKIAKDIAQTLSLSKVAISKRLNALVASGDIAISKMGIINILSLTPQGKSKLTVNQRQLTDSSGGILVNYSKSHNIRIHNQEYKIPLKTRINPLDWIEKRSIKHKVNHLKGHLDVYFISNNVEFRLTPLNLIVHLPDRTLSFNADIIEDYVKTKQFLNDMLKSIDFSLPLKRFDKENYQFNPIKTEIAFENNEIAKESVNESKKIEIYDRKDGKLRAKVDQSVGSPEFEFFHPKKATPDSMNFQNTITQLFDGSLQKFENMVMETIQNILKIQENNTKQNADFAANLTSHKEAIQELRDLARNINQSFKNHSPAKPGEKSVYDLVFQLSSSSETGRTLKWVEILPGVEMLK